MKKKILVLFMMALCATSVFAFDLSAGLDVDYSMQLRNINISRSGGFLVQDFKLTSNTFYHLMGVRAFFDAKYIRVSLGANFSLNGSTTKLDSEGTLIGLSAVLPTSEGNDPNPFIGYVNLSLLGKYPFRVGRSKIYPLVGFDLAFNIIDKYNGNDTSTNKKYLHKYYFVAGFGSDIRITRKLYLSPTAVFGINMKKSENYETIESFVSGVGGKYTDNTMLVNVGIGLGYKF